MVDKLRHWFPLTAIHQELVRFDTQLMEDASISGLQYQKGTLAGFEVREYLLEKFGRKCVYCGTVGVPLNLDHVVPKSGGGSDRLSNLALACVPCNDAKANRPVEEFVTDPVRLALIQSQLKRPLGDIAAVNSTRWALWRELKGTGLPVFVGSAGKTKFNRIRSGLAKSHCNDALAVGDVESISSSMEWFLVADQTGRGSYARTRPDKYGFPKRVFTRRKEHFGFITGDTVRAVVPKGKYSGSYIGRVSVRASGSFAIRTAGGTIPAVWHKHCVKVQRGDGWYFTTAASGDEESHGALPDPGFPS